MIELGDIVTFYEGRSVLLRDVATRRSRDETMLRVGSYALVISRVDDVGKDSDLLVLTDGSRLGWLYESLTRKVT